MLSFDDLLDEAVDCRKAFPNRRGKTLHVYLWDHVRKTDWGFRTINGLTLGGTTDTAATGGLLFGEWGCVGGLLAVLLLVPTVGVRNLLTMPVYERRIKAVVKRIG